MSNKLHDLLEEYISSESYDRGHNGGMEEVEAIASGMRQDLRKVNNLIQGLLEYKSMYEGLSH
jgi:hypothetical protein